MVFLVTKAALAATIVGVGVTFGALSYLASKLPATSFLNYRYGFCARDLQIFFQVDVIKNS